MDMSESINEINAQLDIRIPSGEGHSLEYSRLAENMSKSLNYTVTPLYSVHTL